MNRLHQLGVPKVVLNAKSNVVLEPGARQAGATGRWSTIGDLTGENMEDVRGG